MISQESLSSTMLKYLTIVLIFISLSCFSQKEIKVSGHLRDYFANSRLYFSSYGLKIDKEVDTAKGLLVVENYFEEKLKPHLSYEMTYFKCELAAMGREDSVPRGSVASDFVYFRCVSRLRINNMFSYTTRFLLDSNYQLLRAPLMLEDRRAKELGQVKPFTAFQEDVMTHRDGMIGEIKSVSFEYSHAWMKYVYKVRGYPERKKFHKRPVWGKYWKTYESMNCYIIVDAIDGTIKRSSYELQRYDINPPF